MVNKPLIRPYFWGGYVRGGWLTSHDWRERFSLPGKSSCSAGVIDGNLTVCPPGDASWDHQEIVPIFIPKNIWPAISWQPSGSQGGWWAP